MFPSSQYAIRYEYHIFLWFDVYRVSNVKRKYTMVFFDLIDNRKWFYYILFYINNMKLDIQEASFLAKTSKFHKIY